MENFIKSKLNAETDERRVRLWNSFGAGIELPSDVKTLTFGSSPLESTILCLEQEELDLEMVNSTEVTYIIVRGGSEERNVQNLARLLKSEEAWPQLYSIRLLSSTPPPTPFNSYLFITTVQGDTKSLGGELISAIINIMEPFTLFVLEDEETWVLNYLAKHVPEGKRGYFISKEKFTHGKRTVYRDEVLALHEGVYHSVWNRNTHRFLPRDKLTPLVSVLYSDLGSLHAYFKNIIYFPSISRFELEGWREKVRRLMTEFAFSTVRSVNRKYSSKQDGKLFQLYHTT